MLKKKKSDIGGLFTGHPAALAAGLLFLAAGAVAGVIYAQNDGCEMVIESCSGLRECLYTLICDGFLLTAVMALYLVFAAFPLSVAAMCIKGFLAGYALCCIGQMQGSTAAAYSVAVPAALIESAAFMIAFIAAWGRFGGERLTEKRTEVSGQRLRLGAAAFLIIAVSATLKGLLLAPIAGV